VADGYAFSNWNTPSPPPAGSSQTLYGPQPVFRNGKDWLLSGYRTGVESQYPDGYLGNLDGNRRADKILGAINRMNDRSYSRGVHKGERINPNDYIWPQEFNKWTGLELEKKGKKFAPFGMEPERLVNDGKPGPIDAERASRLRPLAPRWR